MRNPAVYTSTLHNYRYAASTNTSNSIVRPNPFADVKVKEPKNILLNIFFYGTSLLGAVLVIAYFCGYLQGRI